MGRTEPNGAVARIKLGLQDKLFLGNMDAKRDRSFARHFVEAMRLMMQQENPDDYVNAAGEMHTVREFVEAAFTRVGVAVGEGTAERERYLRRIRIGTYRVVYELRDAELIVLVVRIGHRRGVYRRSD